MKRWSDVAERNRALVAENAQRVLADTQYDRFAHRWRCARSWSPMWQPPWSLRPAG